MTSLRAIIYCRVSSKEQTLNLSLPVQEDQCRAFCKLNGWEVDRVFIERGESAKTSNRTELQAALAYLRDQNKRRVRIPTKPATHSDVKAATHSEAKAATLPELAASRAHGGSKWPP